MADDDETIEVRVLEAVSDEVFYWVLAGVRTDDGSAIRFRKDANMVGPILEALGVGGKPVRQVRIRDVVADE